MFTVSAVAAVAQEEENDPDRIQTWYKKRAGHFQTSRLKPPSATVAGASPPLGWGVRYHNLVRERQDVANKIDD